MIIKEADIKYIDGISRVHLDSWKSTYKDILPAELFAKRTYNWQKEKWLNRLFNNDNTNEFMYVALTDDDKVMGFATGSIDDPNKEHDSILFCLYIDDKYHKCGIGRKLVDKVKSKLKKQGAKDMVLWAYKDNTACNFYEHIGGKREKEVTESVGGRDINEVSFVFNL